MSIALHRHEFAAMGCPCELALYASSKRRARQGITAVLQEVHRLDRKYSHYRPDSYLRKLETQAARHGGEEVDPETAALLNFAATQFRSSGGRFDISTRRISLLWRGTETVPADQQIQAAMSCSGWGRVHWDGQRLAIPAGMGLDLGGLVKEYAVDRAAGVLKKSGFDSGYVDLGGDLHFLGPHPGQSPWKVGIRDLHQAARPAAMIDVCRGALASSGHYERFYEIDGVRFSHIIDPLSGWPLQSHEAGLSSVSVRAANCVVAGSLSTFALLLGASEGIRFLKNSGFPWLAMETGRGILHS